MCDDWVIHPQLLYPVKPEGFLRLDTEDWGRIAFYRYCQATEGCEGALEVRILYPDKRIPVKHIELYCPVCDKVQLGPKKRTPPP